MCVDNVMMLPDHGWTPDTDTLLVTLPEDPAKRSALFDHMEHVGKPTKMATMNRSSIADRKRCACGGIERETSGLGHNGCIDK